MSHENHTQNSKDGFISGTPQSDTQQGDVVNSSSVQAAKGNDSSAEQGASTVTKTRKRSGGKVKHVFNNRNMLNSQMQKASLDELKSASELLTETIKTREEEERLAKEKLERDRAAAAKLLEQAKAGGIDPAVLAEVFAC